MRHLGRIGDVMTIRKISGLQIRKMREQAKMSQSVFAKILNITGANRLDACDAQRHQAQGYQFGTRIDDSNSARWEG
jgi:hypothetical protein